VLKSIYLLIQKVQNAQKQSRSEQNLFEIKLEERTTILQSELNRARELVR